MYNHLVKIFRIDAELENSISPYSAQRIKSLRIYGRESGRKFSARRKGTGRALAELENSISPYNAPENLRTRKRPEIALREKGVGRGYAVLE